MESLQNTLLKRMYQTGYNLEKEFSSNSIVFTKNGEDFLNTINYLCQQIASESYLELSEMCLKFNEQFQNENQTIVTEKQKEWLQNNGFEKMIDHLFSNEQLQMNFYPTIKGYFIKDKQNKHYMLVSFQKYDSTDYTGYKLIQFTQPSFSFPDQDNYMN
jgi:hypothetical protein